MRSPGRSAPRRERGARVAHADAGRADVHAVGVAALDDLGVAGDDLRRRRRPRRRPSPRPRRAGRSASRPSSRISARLSASGRAPAIARSLTVPLTARSPIEPPGKRSGLTTNESVVSARRRRARARRRPARSMPNAGTSRPSISVWVALPPAPWAIVMRSSLKRGRFARAVSMIPRIRSASSRARHAHARTSRSCSRRRRRPPARPCTSRSRARACTRCRTPCTPTA